MNKGILLLVFLVSFLLYEKIEAQNSNCNCCLKEYSEFDFWLGEWNVHSPEGKIIGTNTITKKYDNCVIEEKWVSNSKNQGTSLNYYDKSTKLWNQVWVDNSGYVLHLSGNFSANKMILKSELMQGETGYYYNQISWQLQPDGSVVQIWEIFSENSVKISEVFKGIYKKKLI